MALISCRGCAKTISDEARACPYCSFPLKTTFTPKKCLLFQIASILVSIVIVLGILGQCAENEQGNDTFNDASTDRRSVLVELFSSKKSHLGFSTKEYAVLEWLIKDDIKAFTEGRDTFFGDVENTTFVEASTLVKEYNRNEVEADQKYKNNNLLISGKITSVNKDISDKPYIVLNGVHSSQNIHVTFKSNADLNRIVAQQKGQSATFYCQGNGMALGSPHLKNCDFPDVAFEQYAKKIRNELKKLDRQGGKSNNVTPIALVTLLFATELSENSPCMNPEEQKEACNTDIQAAYNKFKGWSEEEKKKRLSEIARKLLENGISFHTKR